MKALRLETKTTNKVHITMYFCRLFLHIDTHLDNYNDFENGFTLYSVQCVQCHSLSVHLNSIWFLIRSLLQLHQASSTAFCWSILILHSLSKFQLQNQFVYYAMLSPQNSVPITQETCIAVYTRKAQVKDFCMTYSLVLYSNTEIKLQLQKQFRISCFVPIEQEQ